MDLLILGASARAAAASAIRIGLRPTCVDLFGDADLAPGCPSYRVGRGQYPEGLFEVAGRLPPMPWLYTGAIENRPDLVDQLAATRRLLGNPGEALRGARDPLALAGALREAGLRSPGIRLDPEGLPVDGSWLRKPLASAGGRGIQPWLGRGADPRRPSYYQEKVEGLPLSATYLGEGGRARCLGIARQYVGKGSNRFAYRGSLAPWPVAAEARERVEGVGRAVASRFGVAGLFGVDLILKDGHPWPVEVNPRYTASVEVLEWALGRSLLAEHLSAFGEAVGGGRGWFRPATFAAKAIVYASRPRRWPSGGWSPTTAPDGFAEVADVPRPGTEFRAGEPVLTVLARGDSPGRCRGALAAGVLAWRRRLGRPAQGTGG